MFLRMVGEYGPWFLRACSTSLLKTLGKGEMARHEPFLLFLQSLLPVWITFCHFHHVKNCRLQTPELRRV